jgi:hypothetical protein
MAQTKGKRLVAVLPEESLTDRLGTEPTLDRTIQKRIGDQLRAMYDGLMQQPVPDRLKDILDRLEKLDKGESS